MGRRFVAQGLPLFILSSVCCVWLLVVWVYVGVLICCVGGLFAGLCYFSFSFSFDVVLLLWHGAVVLWAVCYLVGFC